MQLSEEQHHQVLTQATLRAMQGNKALVVDLFDLQEQLWKELPNNPYDKTYSKPWLLEYFGGSARSQAFGATTLVGDGLALASSLWRAPNPIVATAGGVLGLVGGGALLYRDHLTEERVQLGRKLWNEDYNLVASMVSNGWVIEKALVDIVSNNKVAPEMRESAREALARMATWRIDNDLPTQSTPLPQLLLLGGPADQKVEEAAAAAAKAHDPNTEADKYESRFLAELSKVGASVEEINKLLTPLSEEFNRQAKAQLEAKEAAELERRIGEVVATGQILGLVIGLVNPKAGQAVTTAFEQGAVLYKSIRSMQAALDAGKAIQIASLASGIGAVFAIAGALSALGGSGGGPSPTEAILNAIQTVMEGISKLGEKVEDLSKDVKSFSARTEVSFASVDRGLARLSDQIVKTEVTINAIKLEDIEGDLFAAARDFRATGTAENAFDLLKQAYHMAIFEASRDSQTSELESPSRLAYLVWSLGDTNQSFANWTAAGAALTGGPGLLATALERYPTMLVRATDWFLEADTTRRAKFGDSLEVGSGLEDELSKQTLSNRRAVSPFIATSAISAALDVARRLLLRPDLAEVLYPDADLQPDEMLRDIARVVQWPYRAVSALAAPEARAQARRAYFRAVEGLVSWVMAERLRASKLFKDWAPEFRYSLLLGAEQLSLKNQSDPLYRMSFERGGYSPAEPNDHGLPDESSEIWDPYDLSAASYALDALVAAGGALTMTSIRGWVDQPIAGQPEWFGCGDFHETFVVTVHFVEAEKVPVPVLYLYLVDNGLVSGYDGGFHHPIQEGGAEGQEVYLHAFRAARGRQTEMWDDDGPNVDAINWGPFTDNGYVAINGWMEDVIAHKDKDGLAEITSRMDGQGVSIRAFVLSQNLCEFARAKLLEAHTNEIANSRVAKVSIPQGLIQACSRAWLNMVTIELAQVESGQSRIVPLLKCLNGTPPIVRGDASLLAAVFGDAKTQNAFWGSEVANLLDFWQLEPPRKLHLLALTKYDFDDLVKVEASDPAAHERYRGGHQACICSETLRLHIPYFPSDDGTPVPSGGPATCLPLTHRAIAALNGFSLLTKQLTGWE